MSKLCMTLYQNSCKSCSTRERAQKITSVKIKPEAVAPDDVEMLEDMIQACVNEAISKANELEKEVKPNLLGGM